MKKKWLCSLLLIAVLVLNSLAVFAEGVDEGGPGEVVEPTELPDDKTPPTDEPLTPPPAPAFTETTPAAIEPSEDEDEDEEDPLTLVHFNASQLIAFMAENNLLNGDADYDLSLEFLEDGQWKKADTLYDIEHLGQYNFHWKIRPGEEKFFCFNLYIRNSVDQTVVTLPVEWEWIGEFEVNVNLCLSFRTVTATKVWSNPEEKHPTVWFKLYYKDCCGEYRPVLLDGMRKLEDGVTEVSWKRISLGNLIGRELEYIVKEVDELGNDFTPEGYTKKEEGLKVTNTKIVIPKVSVKAIKIWLTGIGEDPFKRPDVKLQLYRNDEPYGEPVVLNNKTFTYVWKDLLEFDEEDKAYVYRVDEIDVPSGYEKSVRNDGNLFTITNKWVCKEEPEEPEKPDKPDKPKPDKPKPPYRPSLPKTGTDASALYLGLGSLVAGVKLVLKGRRK